MCGALRGALSAATRANPSGLISEYERRVKRWLPSMARYGSDSNFGCTPGLCCSDQDAAAVKLDAVGGA